jgi:hypothetical protein
MADADAAPLPPAKLSILKRLRRDYPVLLLAIPGMSAWAAAVKKWKSGGGDQIAQELGQALEASR